MTAIDPAVFQGLVDDVGGEKEVVDELIESYLGEAPTLLAAGRTATLAKNADGVQHAYHPLKSTSATFGAMRLSVMCREVEQAARTGAIPSLDAVVAMEKEFESVQAELRAKII